VCVCVVYHSETPRPSPGLLCAPPTRRRRRWRCRLFFEVGGKDKTSLGSFSSFPTFMTAET